MNKLRILLAARRANLHESILRMQKTGSYDQYTESQFYGNAAMTNIINAIFGGAKNSSSNGNKSKGVKNLLDKS